MAEKILFNNDWRFHKGEIEVQMPPYKGASYMQAKTEHMLTGPAAYAYNDRINDYRTSTLYTSEKWQAVNLPHDYILLSEPDEQYNCGLGYFKYENAWYRKHFSLCEDDRTKRIALYFEGIATESEVFVNGCSVARNFCGYTSFEVDITDFVYFDKENIVAVHTVTSRHESWWYEGGGICRNVWLKKSSPLHFALYGLYAKPELCKNNTWKVSLSAEIENCFDVVKNADVHISICDNKGNCVGSFATGIAVNEFGSTVAKGEITVTNPMLWSPDTPVLYTVKADIVLNSAICDSESTRIGFRTFTANQNGFFINGKPYKIKGLNVHEDFGFTGRAIPENIHRYKLKMLKEMGANGYRCSHYPQNEALMDALDEEGFIVMAETRHFDSSEEGIKQLEMLIKRDRNHPSIFFWSLGNEEPRHRTENGLKTFRRMRAAAKKLDDTRLFTSAVCAPPEKAPIMAELDVIGINYNLDMYDDARRLYPDKAFIATEYSATSTTRGWYKDDCPARGYMSAYDKDTDSLFRSREYSWKVIAASDDILGGYQWDGFEHRGECLWPRLCSQAGAIDLFLRKKDAFYQNLSQWSSAPMIHMLPHWNLPEKDGTLIRVVAYTNCEEAELFLGNISLGKQLIEKYGIAEWKVPYVDKKVKVVGYINGKATVSDFVERTGTAVSLKLELDNDHLAANGDDIAIVSCYALDVSGRKVPSASCLVSFATNKLGQIVGTGSDVCDHNRVDLPVRRMREGVVAAAIRVGNEGGILKVYAEADGLAGDTIEITLKEKN